MKIQNVEKDIQNLYQLSAKLQLSEETLHTSIQRLAEGLYGSLEALERVAHDLENMNKRIKHLEGLMGDGVTPPPEKEDDRPIGWAYEAHKANMAAQAEKEVKARVAKKSAKMEMKEIGQDAIQELAEDSAARAKGAHT